MTDRVALYTAVLTRPDDDTPRLVYADYLDDTGDRADAIRARFIRNQVKLARVEPWSDEHDPLLRATAPVEFHYAKEWGAGLDGLALPQGHVFRRGFLDGVTCYSKTFVSSGGKVFDLHPVRSVKFAAMKSTRGAATAIELAACPHLARLHTVWLGGSVVDDSFISAVGASAHAAGVHTLTLSDTAVGVAALGKFGAGLFPGLRELEVWNAVYETAGAKKFAQAKGLAKLSSLSVCQGAEATGAPLRGPGAVALAESPHLAGLTELELRNQELRKKGAEAFAAAYAWPGLKRLSLRGNRIPGPALAAFAANPKLASLAEIDLTGNPVKAEDAAPLRAACPHLRVRTDDTEVPIPITRLAPEDRP